MVADHRSREGRRVAAYERGLIAPFAEFDLARHLSGQKAPQKPPADVREAARTAGHLLLEETSLLQQTAELRGRPKKGRELRRLERRLLSVRGMRLGIEKLLHERAKKRGGWR